MLRRKQACQLGAAAFLLPGLACLVAVFVPALRGTGFWEFSVRYWWQLFFAGSALYCVALIACALIHRRRSTEH
jgi:hypothetical protein